jgi:endonuclease YncB( thermonuclease family)
MRPSRTFVSLAIVLLWSQLVIGEDFTRCVVGVSEGDTITVMHAGRGERIRLHGIDAPGRGQASRLAPGSLYQGSASERKSQ